METTPLLVRPSKKSIWSRIYLYWFRKRELNSRVITLGQLPDDDYPPNYVCNQKYNIITFLPLVLYEQFSFFLNLYFLVMSISQFIPSIKIGYLYTYWGPLGFVLSVTLFREAIDDFRRFIRDREVNRQHYERMVLKSPTTGPCDTECVPASALRVGDIIMLHKGQRVPADMILLRTNEVMGAVYIRTDQLDGETDWKLRIPLSTTQKLPSDEQLLDIPAQIYADKPKKDIHSFIGSCAYMDEEVLGIENTLWSGCVVASGQITGLVIYTGSETRSVMNNATPRSKVGKLDLKVNNFTKLLFVAVFFISFLMIVLKGFNGPWFAFLFRFLLLFSYIIPISLRVNLDIGKAFYSWTIQRDKAIEGTVVRSTTIPEDLGRIQYLLADKTGTLTKNEMVFKKLHLGNGGFDITNFHEVESLLTQYVTKEGSEASTPDVEMAGPSPRQVWDVVLGLALCHNVTPVYEVDDRVIDDSQSDMANSVVSESCGGAVPQQQLCDYQASSPDEVALVKWTDMMGVSLYKRDIHTIVLKLRAANEMKEFKILQIFPFTSESKMMGIIVQDEASSEITYYVKGADVAIDELLGFVYLGAECTALANEGLRTLLFAKKTLTDAEYLDFESKYKESKLVSRSRRERIDSEGPLYRLQRGLTPLALTGVEDRLADKVTSTLATLRAAGVKIWMLTGDKLETALCIARSLHLGGGDGSWEVAELASSRCGTLQLLHRLQSHQMPFNLVICGETLEVFLAAYESETVELLGRCGGVVVARCSPTQKARVARLLRQRGRCVAAAGDGGNDVAMIQEADMGIGIEGAEGRAASLAGDVSIRSFSALARLLLVHGRRATMRSAALCLFIVHRGLIVSTMQAVFSLVFYYSSVSLYPGFLMVGYGTVYTMLPVFSLVLDRDIPSITALQNPHLYKQLAKGRQLSYKTFLIWTVISIYQGGVIMYGALILFEDQLIHIVEISYTALILTELIMVAITIVTWHHLMIVAEIVSLLMYTATLLIFTSYFDADFLKTWDFWWKVTTITLVSCLPLYIVKYTRRKWRLRQYRNILK